MKEQNFHQIDPINCNDSKIQNNQTKKVLSNKLNKSPQNNNTNLNNYEEQSHLNEKMNQQQQIPSLNGVQSHNSIKKVSNDQHENKTNKLNIKKLIQMKQTRQAKQKSQQIINKAKDYFKPTFNSNIQRCTICGQSTFGINKGQKKTFKVNHLQKNHPQLFNRGYKNTDLRDEEQQEQAYAYMAKELFNFVHESLNKQIIECILGKHFKQFTPYVQRMPVNKDIEKLVRTVETSYSLI